MKFTGLDTECSLLSKSSPVFRDVSLTKPPSRTESEPAQSSQWFVTQELLSGWLLRGSWVCGVQDGCGWSWSVPVWPHPWAGSQGQPSLPPSLLFQAVQDTPWSHFCSTSSTWMFSLNTLLVTQRSTEKSQIHGKVTNPWKSSFIKKKQLCNSVWERSCFPDWHLPNY